jgi:hypothetical protein
MRLILPFCLSLAAALAGCSPKTEPQGNVSDEAQAPVAETREPPAPAITDALLLRRDLLLATAQAASDFALGADDRQRQQELNGRPFSFVIPLCDPYDRGALFTARLDEEGGAARLEVRPDLRRGPPAGSTGGQGIETVEGFWLRRPWLLDPKCPVSEPVEQGPVGEAEKERGQPGTAQGPMSEPLQLSVGIAQFLDETSARSLRRGDRPYQITRRLAPGESIGPVDLEIEGRMRALPDGRVIACEGRFPDKPPTCILSVGIDRVRLLQRGGEPLAEWASGG